MFLEISTRGCSGHMPFPRGVLGRLRTHNKGRVRPSVCPDVAVSGTDVRDMALFSDWLVGLDFYFFLNIILLFIYDILVIIYLIFTLIFIVLLIF